MGCWPTINFSQYGICSSMVANSLPEDTHSILALSYIISRLRYSSTPRKAIHFFILLFLPKLSTAVCCTLKMRRYSRVKGIYLSKALTCMKFFLYKQKNVFYQGDRYLWSHCYMNNLYISHRSLYAPTYSF